mgnify:CR=1 FL=1
MHDDPDLPGEAQKDRLAAESPRFRKEDVEHHSRNEGGDKGDEHDDVHNGIDCYFSHRLVIGTDPILITWGYTDRKRI